MCIGLLAASYPLARVGAAPLASTAPPAGVAPAWVTGGLVVLLVPVALLLRR